MARSLDLSAEVMAEHGECKARGARTGSSFEAGAVDMDEGLPDGSQLLRTDQGQMVVSRVLDNYYCRKGVRNMPISADLGDQLEGVVEKLVKNGRYNSKSEVLREGVRLVQEREARLAELEAALARGIADAEAGRVIPMDEAFARLRDRLGLPAKTEQ
jgi:antitoxin ParD1/3/4